MIQLVYGVRVARHTVASRCANDTLFSAVSKEALSRLTKYRNDVISRQQQLDKISKLNNKSKTEITHRLKRN